MSLGNSEAVFSMSESPKKTSEKSSLTDSFHETAKTITIFRNGRKFDSGRKIVWNNKQIRTWDSFIDYLSLITQSPIRIIKTPNNGRSVKRYEEIQHSGSYVAIDKYQKFVPMKYFSSIEKLEISNPTANIQSISYIENSKKLLINRWNFGNSPKNTKLINQNNLSKIPQELTKKNNLRKLPKMSSKIIFVYRNGDIFTGPTKIIFNHRSLVSMEKILENVAEKVTLVNNKPIKKIYTSLGKLVKSPSEIFNLEDYVAASNERFTDSNYGFCFQDYTERKTVTNVLSVEDEEKRKINKNRWRKIYKFGQSIKNKPTELFGNGSAINKFDVLPPIGFNNETTYNKEKAAQCIQASFRGFKVREDFRNKNDIDIQDKSAIVIQSAFRDHLIRVGLETFKINSQLKRIEAAQKIQFSFRSWKLRKAISKYLEKEYYLTD